MQKSSHAVIWGLTMALYCGVSLAPPAWACLNAVEISRKQAVKLINDAEAALAAGDPMTALVMLNNKLDHEEGYEVGSSKLDKRLQRVWAVARLRAGDSADLEAAVAVLREQSRDNRNDPWLQVRLAEALSRTKKGQGEARKILEDLAKRDLIVDPEGFATLARLRRGAKDEAGAAQALQRCQAMAKKAEVCSDAPLPEPKQVSRRAPTTSRDGLANPDFL